MILASNRPGDLDAAVLSRIDESVEFGLPDAFERERMMHLYFEKYVAKPLGIHLGGKKRNALGDLVKENEESGFFGLRDLQTVRNDLSSDGRKNLNKSDDEAEPENLAGMAKALALVKRVLCCRRDKANKLQEQKRQEAAQAAVKTERPEAPTGDEGRSNDL